MLLGTFRIDNPILRDALASAPDVTVRWEKSDLTADGRHQMLLWVHGGDYEAFDAGLESDPTVHPPSEVIDFDDRRLYRIELTSAGHSASVYPTVIEEGGVLREVTGTHEGWQFRAAFPDEKAIDRFYSFFADREADIELRQLYEEREFTDGNQYGLTDEQRETLVAAVDAGYFDIPRSCSLAELGDRFDISPNATSERFRRGVKTLVENTIYGDADAP